MSSEGTLSVGGEEGVRDVTSSSISTSSSSSSSSGGSGGRTLVSGGSRGRILVSGGNGDQEGGLFPTNILEVADNWGRCYDESDEVVGEVMRYESCWRCRGELGHLVENYSIPPHVLVRLARGEERACSAPKDHWMPLYANYLAAGLRFPIPELLVALLKEYGLGLTQLVPNGVRLGGSGKEKGWFYFTPRIVGGRSRNLFTAGPSSIKGWKEKFIFVDDTEWGRGDREVEELSRWKGKRRNPNQYRLGEVEKDEGGSGKEKGWFYFTPRVVGGKSRNLFTAGPSSIKGWKEKFIFVDDTEWGRGDREVEELSRWKGKRRNPNQYRLGEVEKDEVKMLERGGGELANIMYLTNPEVVESSGIYGRSSLSREEMNRLRAGGRPIRLPEKRSRASTSGAQEERVGGGTSRPPAEVGPSSKPRKGVPEEVIARKRPRVEEVQPLQVEAPVEFVPRPAPVQIDPALRETEVVVPGRGKSSVPYPRQVASFYDSGTLVPTFPRWTCKGRRMSWPSKRKKCEEALARRESELAEVKKAAELAVHNSVEENVLDFVKSATFAEVADLYCLPTLVMAFTDCRKKVKAQNPEVDMTSITFGPEEAGVEENGDSKTAEFRPDVKLTWERDEAGKTILPSTLDFEFVAVDEEEAEVAPSTEVGDNMRNEEVDQHLQIID
ncbi:hypothetical protein SLEP1_g56912 [Rubroshorea leprosula]|uniref:Uncharacterized protein n=1 Tax=Rubroshorea leprosula TaxID=152421 RepID=A0AAV5MMF7_9ROSI|nr:hypothetical protein SLEP1_g56912 [Rubroshorea leprosula]